ncbi:leukocyte elastase inhibitor-like [Paramacrobiotus metropolitanus]|uniref:leukocyte elastase inhibitor-like n=1 Tax=Paramacrobiotus metropolitanus TaxID=2943436 RepID=UPI002445E0C2|nr:leukocyte elastase inhibitor-like [Paramacrobiotus metropolitanus]
MGKFLDIIKSCFGRETPPPPPRQRKTSSKYFTTEFGANSSSRRAVAVFQAIVSSANSPDANIILGPYLAEIMVPDPNDTLKSSLFEAFHNSIGGFLKMKIEKDAATTFGGLECVNAAFSDDSCRSAFRPEKVFQSSVCSELGKEPIDKARFGQSATLNCFFKEKLDGITLSYITHESRRIILNTAEFSYRWDYAFERTESGTFYCPNNIEKTVEFLINTVTICRAFNVHRGGDRIEADEPQMIVFHAEKGKFSIMLLLPAPNNNTISSLEKELTIEKLLEWRRKSTQHLWYVIIPKMKINIGGGIAAGSEKPRPVTNSAAEFEGKQPPERVGPFRPPFVLNLDENGINATEAPYSSKQYNLLLYEPEFVANRPFLMIIWDEMANGPVFIGRITDPTGTTCQIPPPYCDQPLQSGVLNQ